MVSSTPRGGKGGMRRTRALGTPGSSTDQYGVPMNVLRRACDLVMMAETPKSAVGRSRAVRVVGPRRALSARHAAPGTAPLRGTLPSLTSPLLFRSTLAAFMSRWMTPLECMCDRPFRHSCVLYEIWSSRRPFLLVAATAACAPRRSAGGGESHARGPVRPRPQRPACPNRRHPARSGATPHLGTSPARTRPGTVPWQAASTGTRLRAGSLEASGVSTAPPGGRGRAAHSGARAAGREDGAVPKACRVAGRCQST